MIVYIHNEESASGRDDLKASSIHQILHRYWSEDSSRISFLLNHIAEMQINYPL